MPDFSQLTEVPEEQWSLYLNDKSEMSTMTISDDAYSARFRHEMSKEDKDKQNYFGMVEIKNTSYASPFFKGLARGIANATPAMGRGLARMGTDAIVEGNLFLQDMSIHILDAQIGMLVKLRDVDKMMPDQQKDFYKNDPEYNALFNKIIGKYDNKIELEDPKFDAAVNETYGEIKKRNEQWVSTWGVDKNGNDSEFMYGLGEGVASLAGAIALTAVTKNPKAASVSFGIGQTGSVYEELREKGVDSKTAIKYAVPAGLAEGALEGFGLHLFVENLSAKTIMRMFARNTAVEMIQEGSQQTVEEVLMSQYRPEEMKEKVRRVAISMVYGGLLGGAASIVSRPILVKKSNELKKDLVKKHGLTSEDASTLVSDVLSGSLEEKNAAVVEIQKIIGVSEWKKEGFTDEEAVLLAGRMIYSKEDIQNEVLRASNAELDPETYEGGSIENSIKFFDKELQRDFISEDFDIKDMVKKTAMQNGVSEKEADLAGTLSESFARVVSNLTNESPREQWENGGELIVEDKRKRSNVLEKTEINENGELVVGGKILFQSEIKSVIEKAKEPGTFKDSVKIGKVKNWLVKAASKIGLDITGYEHSIDVSAVKHIVKKHGNVSAEDQRGNIAITDNDIQLIPSIVADPDYVVFGTETRAHKDGITYIKRMDDGTTFYVEEVRSGQKTLSAQTLYKRRSVQLTADSIRASVVLRPKRLTDRIDIIANPNKDVKTLFQSANNPRGYIKITEMQNIITILQNGNPSTIVHELGHYFVNRYVSVLEKAGYTEEMKGVMEWLGVENISQIGEKEEERFARGFETYIMEGVSPNAKMDGIFSRFKQWLCQVYTDLTQGKIIQPEEINDNVRSFFDKMLATDEDITLDIESMKGKINALKDVIQNSLDGKEVSLDGVTVEDVNELLKIMNQRIPRKPKNLTQLLREVGIDIDFAKIMDIREAMALQDEKGGSGGLFRKGGAINKEDALVEFLKNNGFIFGDSETYSDVSNLWDDAMIALENSDNLYRQEDQEQIHRRKAILEAVNVASQALAHVDYDSVLRAINELRSKNIVAVQKDSLKYIKNKLKSIDSDYKKVIRNLLKSQKDDFEAHRNDLIDFIKGQPLTGDSKVKLLGQIKKANSLNTFQKVAQTIRERSLEYYARGQKKVLIDKIQSELKQTLPSGGIQKQGYDYAANTLFEDLREYNKMNQTGASSLLSQMFSGASSEDLEMADEADKIRRRFVAYKSKGAETSAELLNAIYQDITRMKEIGKSAKNEAHYNEMLTREEDRQELIKILDNSKAKAGSIKTQAMNFYRRGFANLYSLMNSMFGKEIADKYEFETKQTDVDAKIYLKTREVIEQGAKIFGVNGKTGLLDLFAAMSNQKSTLVDIKEGLDQDVDRFQIMDIYNGIKNEKTRNDYYRNFGQEQIDGLVSTLSVKEKIFSDFLQDTVNGYYEAMNKVYIQLYDIDLPKVENYWPATSEHKDAIDIQGDYYNQATTPSAFKERAKGAKIPIPKSAWEKFGKHIAEAEYITGLGVDYMNVKRIFKSRRIESKIKKHYGDAVYRNLMDDIEALSISHKIQVIDDVSGLFQKGLNNWVIAKIALNPSVFFNQLTSMTNYVEHMPFSEWSKYFAEGLMNPKETAKYMMEQAPFMQARFGNGYNEAISRAITEASRFGKKKGKWSEVLTSLTRIGDIGSIIYGGYPYMKYLQEQGDKEAVKKFEFATLRSQQAGTDVSLSPFQRNKGAMRFFLAFKNTPQQYMRKIVDAQVMIKNGDITAGQYAKTMFNYMVVQPTLYIMMGNFIRSLLYFNDDDDDEKSVFDGVLKQIILSPMDGVPVVADIMKAVYDMTFSDKAPYSIISYPMIDDVESGIRKIMKEDKSLFDYADIVSPFIEILTAVPAKTTLRFLQKNFYKE